MRRLIVDVPTKTFKVQGGYIWEDVDEAAGQYDFAMVGGTLNHNRVGGLTHEGGYRWLPGLYGLTTDSLLSVQKVLADGSIKDASVDEYADLFWAAYNQKNEIWAGQLVFPSGRKLDEVVAFGNDFVSTSNGDSGMVVGITAGSFISEPTVVMTHFQSAVEQRSMWSSKDYWTWSLLGTRL